MHTNSSSPYSRILILGSLPTECQWLQQILTTNGYAVSIAEPDGQLEQAPFDLVILHAILPDLRHRALIQQIRQQQMASFIPVLLITANDSLSLLRSLETEANDFMAAPAEPNHLLNRVQVLLKWKQLMEELIQLNQQREDFVACLLHDLRSPLSATNQVLRQMLQGVFGNTLPELELVLNQIAENNQSLILMVETLLDSYRYETGQQSLNFLPVDLAALSQQIVDQMSPLATQKGLALTLHLEVEPGQEPPVMIVLGDHTALYRLLLNLISNAIQYTESGSIEVRLYSSVSTQPSTREQITIEVADTGSGIPTEGMETIFERFQQSSAARRGYGLGLYLSKQIVESHQGSLTVRVNQGRGSVFTIRLPTRPTN
ncbi:MAG: HAMP domain-containing histidine kinase [Tildeniella nuda ZEHNDER 1965/U140]|jgi:signal transduction histidine kinase|nr:HAMP domain-containing histidine kinase [Tildeniella nuda ZEHNDER 1965/U140]